MEGNQINKSHTNFYSFFSIRAVFCEFPLYIPATCYLIQMLLTPQTTPHTYFKENIEDALAIFSNKVDRRCHPAHIAKKQPQQQQKTICSSLYAVSLLSSSSFNTLVLLTGCLSSGLWQLNGNETDHISQWELFFLNHSLLSHTKTTC